MNWKRIILWLFTLLLSLCIILYGPKLLRKVGADLGGFSGDSDYGDSDSGSSWSSSDSGSNWGGSDYGRSSGSNRRPSSSRGSSEPPGPIEKLFYGLLLLIIGLSPIAIYIKINKYLDDMEKIRKWRARSQGTRPSGDLPGGAERTSTSRLRPMSEYAKVDPNFSESDMIKQFSDLYVRMQEGCTARNIEGIRHWFSDGLYQQFDRQLKDLTDKGWINHVEDIHIENVELRGWFFEGGKDHLVAEVKTQIVDYTVNEDSGALISGSKTARKHMTYEWDLSRPMGTLTPKTGETVERRCPNCGATLTANESAKCPYCGAVITFKDHDWTIYAIKGIAQRTEQS